MGRLIPFRTVLWLLVVAVVSVLPGCLGGVPGAGTGDIVGEPAHPPASVCGNGNVLEDVDEECDDGNSASGDGCDSTCRVEPNYQCTLTDCYLCGNGYVEPTEGCDDGNFESGDGCSAELCRIERGYRCLTHADDAGIPVPPVSDCRRIGADAGSAGDAG